MAYRTSTLSFFVVLLLIVAGCSGSQEATSSGPTEEHVGEPLTIEAPPSGSLSDAQLNTIANDVRALEERPLADGAVEARASLFEWIQSSPDVSVTLCGGVVRPLMESESTYQAELLLQFILSSAAHIIEHPDDGQVSVNVGGLEGALTMYRVLKEQRGSDAADSYMEAVAGQSEDGTLDLFVESRIDNC